MYSDLQYLSVPLPEDVLKLKYYGDFERLHRVIDLKLSGELPLPLRRRLELEKEIARLWPLEYPHTQEEALSRLQMCFTDFSESELEQLRDLDQVEWAYINGQVRYKNNFLSNLIKTQPRYEARLKEPERLRYKRENAAMLNEIITRMKKEGQLAARIHMRSSMRIAGSPQRAGQAVWAHLPLPMEYAQVKRFRLLGCSHPDAVIAPGDFPQRTVCFHAVPDKPFSVEYTYETHMRYTDPDPAQACDQQPTFYTEEYAPHMLFTPYLRALAGEIVGTETNPLRKARRIYDFITTKITYCYMRAYMTMPNVAEYAAACRKGDCGVQALLFIVLCRIAGIPARWQSGLEVSPLDVGSHDWAQFYVAPYGWLFADCSFGGAAYRMGHLDRWNFYFGNLDPYRLPANAEYQHDFYVPFRHLRHDPYDNQQGEAEYADAPVPAADMDTHHEALLIELI